MSRVVVGLLAGLILSLPAAQAQNSYYGNGGGGYGFGGGIAPSGGNSSTQPRTFYVPANPFIRGTGGPVVPVTPVNPYVNPYGYGYGYGSYGLPIFTTPIYQAPLAVPGISGYFRIGSTAINYWRAPSGYYYPWGCGINCAQTPIYIVERGVSTPQLPPISSLLSDMEKYLDESRKSDKLSQTDYQRLFRRLQDIRGKYDHERAASGGALDNADEEYTRKSVDLLAGEISRAVKPIR